MNFDFFLKQSYLFLQINSSYIYIYIYIYIVLDWCKNIFDKLFYNLDEYI